MEVPEPPECPVCLNVYDSVSVIPRVLSCGHSTCELCLPQLPNPFPNTTRCPSCTQLVKLPDRPSSLPKNIDLLRLSSSLQNLPDGPSKVNSQKPSSRLSHIDDDMFVGNLWSPDFYLEWKDWVLQKDSILLEEAKTEDGLLCGGKIVKSVNNRTNENQEVVLVKLDVFSRDETEKEVPACKFMYSYQAKIMKVLFFMEENERFQLGLVLKASLKANKVGRIYGFWCNEDDDCVFMVCQSFARSLAIVGELENGFLRSTMAVFEMMGMEICEVIRDLHVEGLVVGCLGVLCFALDEYGHIWADFSQMLLAGRRVCRMVNDGNEDQKNKALQECVFLCPEFLFEVLRNEEMDMCGTSKYEVGYGSDVWSVACIFMWMLFGEQIAKEVLCYNDCLFNSVIDQEGCDFLSLYTGWKEKLIASLDVKLGSELISLKDVLTLLSKCLEFDPKSRPTILEVWQCVKKLIFTPQLSAFFHSEMRLVREEPVCCIGLSNLCQTTVKTKKGRLRQVVADSVEEDKNNGIVDACQNEGLRDHKDVVDGLTSGLVKCIDLKAHLDCITGLAIGGGFLFSCSHDKIVNVWSLQDFSHVHSFRKHEHRVTAVVFVDEGEPLCISADNGGAICIWGATAPLDATPRHIISEQKDWRYSGIHALAISGTGFLCTGSGDKLIKAWSLKDYTLASTMSGHKSVVSSLAVSGGILYSGSWDGTVRLWSLNDYKPVAVLGEDRPVSSVLSLAVDGNLLLVAHENGHVMIWYDSVLLKSSKVHDGAVFSIIKSGKWLLSGGWDKKIHMHELSGDGLQLQALPVGSISCDSVVASLLYWQRKLFVGQADKIVKVYHSGV